MKFLFEQDMTVADRQEQLTIYETAENSYFAAFSPDEAAAGFHFHRSKDEWVADDPSRQEAAEALGVLIDNFKTDRTF